MSVPSLAPESVLSAHPVSAAMWANGAPAAGADRARPPGQACCLPANRQSRLGLCSPDSDYDVRFIYVHRLPWYLGVERQRDVIEVPISSELDISGWDAQGFAADARLPIRCCWNGCAHLWSTAMSKLEQARWFRADVFRLCAAITTICPWRVRRFCKGRK